MERKEIERLLLEEELTITDVIDTAISLNGIIGVRLITLGEQLNEYCISKINKRDYYGE